jgi:hypothetical protein
MIADCEPLISTLVEREPSLLVFKTECRVIRVVGQQRVALTTRCGGIYQSPMVQVLASGLRAYDECFLEPEPERPSTYTVG